MPESASSQKQNKENENDPSRTFLVHRSWFFRTVSVNTTQTIVTHNIAKDWDEKRVKHLESSVQKLVDRNPILSGVLRMDKDGTFVDGGKFTKFVYQLETPDGIPSPRDLFKSTYNSMDVAGYVQNHIEPHVPGSKKGSEEANEKLQIFSIHIMLLPDGYVYYAPRLSHSVGDGRTYYMLLEELNAIFTEQQPLPDPIRWESEPAAVFESMAQSNDIFFAISMVLCIVYYKIFGFPATRHLHLSKEKIDNQKKHLANQGSFLSTNDIITAALAQSVVANYYYFGQLVSFRGGRWPGVGVRDGGNITRLVPFNTEEACDPNNVRNFARTMDERGNDHHPCWSLCTGSCFMQTNWASITEVLDGTVFHSPLKDFIDRNDVPAVIIYQPNDKEIGVMYRLEGVHENAGLLGELIV